MDIIFWRHADAEDATPGQADADRPLTAKGRKQAKKMGRWLREKLPADCRVLVSPALRTRQTADALGVPVIIERTVGCGHSAATLLAAIRRTHDDGAVLVVGHQPTLGETILHLLLSEKKAAGGISVRKGSVWWLRVQGGRPAIPAAVLLATMDPDFLD